LTCALGEKKTHNKKRLLHASKVAFFEFAAKKKSRRKVKSTWIFFNGLLKKTKTFAIETSLTL
jgi:hypothetical protein